jgi:hypothetical protein
MPNNSSYSTPVLVIFFNRPDTLEQVLLKLREIKPKKVFLAQDGARENNESDMQNIIACREVVDSVIDWDCDVEKLYRDKNLGCRHAVSQGIDWFFSNVEEGIILEDDCVPHDNFFTFTAKMLEQYRDDDRIGMVCGSNVTNQNCGVVDEDYYFSRMPLVWGWASWRRVWKNYDVTLSQWPKNKNIVNFLNDKILIKNWVSIFHRVYVGKIGTWDYQLNFMFWKNNFLTIVPKENLITNIGFDDRATHTKEQPEFLKQKGNPEVLNKDNYIGPDSISPNSDRDNSFLKDQVDPNVTHLKNFVLSCMTLIRSLRN